PTCSGQSSTSRPGRTSFPRGSAGCTSRRTAAGSPARELVLPGSTDIFDPEIVGTLAREVAERWVGLDRLGVLTGLKAAVVGEVATGPTLLDAEDVPPPAAWEDYLGELTDRLGP